MVSWRDNQAKAQSELERKHAIEVLRWNNHAAKLAKQKEADLMAAKKRPPLAWDGKKPLPFVWALYERGRVVPDVQAYDIEAGWFSVFGVRFENNSFLVKRLS